MELREKSRSIGGQRKLPALFAVLAIAITCAWSAGGAVTASAATDAYCAPCFSGNYGLGVADPRSHQITLSYAHMLSPKNQWVCVGDAQTKEYVCGVNETYRSYSESTSTTAAG
jgi:hypothetical protein